MSTLRDHDVKDNDLRDTSSSERRVPEKSPEFKRANLAMFAGPKLTTDFGQGLQKDAGPSSRWNVVSANKIPSYPLERPVKVDGTPNAVATRIDESTRKRSVQGEFDSEKARAICTTSSFLKYHVTLFDGGDNVTIIEVQRRIGCALEFRKERLAIINAAKGTHSQSQSMPRLTIPPDLECKVAPPSEEEVTAMIESAVLRLHEKQRDSRLLSLHHLACMTDAEKANTDTAYKAALIILDSDIGVREIITEYLMSGPQDETGIKMINFALQVLTNCFTLLEGDTIEELSKKEHSWFTESLFPSLIDDIKYCKSYHNAFLSSKCLCVLIKKSSIMFTTAQDNEGLRDILEKAALIGEKNHANLYGEAQSTIRALKCM